jgi:hypothetical protein
VRKAYDGAPKTAKVKTSTVPSGFFAGHSAGGHAAVR